MARNVINVTTKDPMTDGGSVLVSLVQGEALEFPVALDFTIMANEDYLYYGALVEGQNDGEGNIPTSVQPTGVEDELVVRRSNHVGEWDSAAAYDAEDVVVDSFGEYYRLLSGVSYTNSLQPSDDDNWYPHDPRICWIQFPSTLSATYAQQPLPGAASYGFFELRVTEVGNTVFTTIWKPVRGLVEFLFSPTSLL